MAKANEYRVFPVWEYGSTDSEIPFVSLNAADAADMANAAFAMGAEEVVIRIRKVEK